MGTIYTIPLNNDISVDFEFYSDDTLNITVYKDTPSAKEVIEEDFISRSECKRFINFLTDNL